MIEAALADLDPSESSLGSWADECERADAALAATEAQLGRTGDRPEMDAALAAAESWMEKEDRELLAALEAAMATLHHHPPPPPIEAREPASRQGEGGPTEASAAAAEQRPQGLGGRIKEVAPAVKQGTQAVGESATRGNKQCPTGTEGEEDEIQVVGVHQGGLTLPARVKEGRYD